MHRSAWISAYSDRATGRLCSISEMSYRSLKMNNLINTFNMKTVYLLLWMCGCLISVQAYAQTNITVTGNVIDENRQPLGGVTVLSGQPLRALGTTDDNGNFRFSVPAGATLVFRIIGYQERSEERRVGKEGKARWGERHWR